MASAVRTLLGQGHHDYHPHGSVRSMWDTLWGDVTTSDKYGGMLIAEVLKAHGVEHVFGMPDTDIIPIFAGCQEKGINTISMRDQATAAFAAEAMGRLTGMPGVVVVAAGPGITNIITAIKNAQMAESPVLVLSGGFSKANISRQPNYELDQMELFRPICKFTACVQRVRDIIPTLRKAFQEARSGVTGPVYIELPPEVLFPINEVRARFGLMERMTAEEVLKHPDLISEVVVPDEQVANGVSAEEYVRQKKPTASVYLQSSTVHRNKRHLFAQHHKRETQTGEQKEEHPETQQPEVSRATKFESFRESSSQMFQHPMHTYDIKDIFANGFKDTNMEPLPVSYPHAGESDIRRIVDLTKQAKQPLIILQNQTVLQKDQSMADLRTALERLCMPVFLSGNARGLLGGDHPLLVRQNRSAAIEESDFVLVLGRVGDPEFYYEHITHEKSTVVLVDRGAENFLPATGMISRLNIPIHADPAYLLIQLADHIQGSDNGVWKNWLSTLKDRENNNKTYLQEMSNKRVLGRDSKQGEQLVNPVKLMDRVDQILEDNSIVVVDAGDFGNLARYMLRPRSPMSWLDAGPFGALGVGAGYALGAKLARPQSKIYLIWGDGSIGFSLTDIDTMVRCKAGAIGIVGTDGCFSSIERQIPTGLDCKISCSLGYSSYEDIARGFGAKGIRVERSEDIDNKLTEARRESGEAQFVLLNAFIGCTGDVCNMISKD